MKSLLVLSAITLAAPAAAQTVGAPASTNAAQPATPATSATPAQTPQPATDAPSAQGATPATPASPGASASPAANSEDAVAQVVTNDWSKYDADTNDGLSKTEFGKWMNALQEQSSAQKAQAKPAGWTDAAFTQADKDKNGAVSKTELQTFLKG